MSHSSPRSHPTHSLRRLPSHFFILLILLGISSATSIAQPLRLEPHRRTTLSQSDSVIAFSALHPLPPDGSDSTLSSPIRAPRHLDERSPPEPPALLLAREVLLPEQGSASDGGGEGFNAPAVLWIAFAVTIGIPMAFSGFRCGRYACGISLGLAGSLFSWAAIINSEGSESIPDLVITLVSMVLFVIGFAFGAISWGYYPGIFCLGFEGGMALGVRLVLLREDLLIHGKSPELYRANWAVVGTLAAFGGLAVIPSKTQRWALILGCASIGSFLIFLGADLIVHKQSGMSRGLRLFFDRNNSHYVDNIAIGYHPTMVGIILVAVSIVATFVFAVGQWRFHHGPFDAWRRKQQGKDVFEISLPINSKGSHVKTASVGSFQCKGSEPVRPRRSLF